MHPRGRHTYIYTREQKSDDTQTCSHPSRNMNLHNDDTQTDRQESEKSDDTHTIPDRSRNLEVRNSSVNVDDQKPVHSSAKFTHIKSGKVSTKNSAMRSRTTKNNNFGTPSQDIRNFFIKSNRKKYDDNRTEGGGGLEVVLGEIGDGQQETINYPMFNDRGPSLFSLETYEQFQDMGQDDLLEITTSYWHIFKGGGSSISTYSIKCYLLMT